MHNVFEPPLIMASLFWQEFLSECGPEVRLACEQVVSREGQPSAISDIAVAQATRRFLDRLAGHRDWHERLEEASTFVNRLVLPRGE